VNTSDFCKYSKLVGSDCVIIRLYVEYVDDMLIFCTNVHVVNETKELLSFHSESKDMGKADVNLGIKIIKTNDGVLCISLIN